MYNERQLPMTIYILLYTDLVIGITYVKQAALWKATKFPQKFEPTAFWKSVIYFTRFSLPQMVDHHTGNQMTMGSTSPKLF